MIKYKKLHKNASIEEPKKEGDAGYDIKTTSYEIENDTIIFKTGIAIEMPPLPVELQQFGWSRVCLAFMRSSIANFPFILSNAVGVIDFGYRGEILAKFKITNRNAVNSTLLEKFVSKPIIQLVFIMCDNSLKLKQVGELSKTQRGENGYGHTDVLE